MQTKRYTGTISLRNGFKEKQIQEMAEESGCIASKLSQPTAIKTTTNKQGFVVY